MAGAALAPASALPSAIGGGVVDPQERAVEYMLEAGRFAGAPDGRRREVWGYNRRLIGPTVRAREGETLRIKVVNDLGVPTSVHWHGIHQHGTWQMDGVEDVSRPPIPAGAEFVYEFRADPAGTHWYHSHAGLQYGNGLFGPLIVEERAPIARYDREEILLINDWFLEPGDTLLAGLLKPHDMNAMPGMKGAAGKADMKKMPGMSGMPGKMDMKKDQGDVSFQSGLINGKGRATGDTTTPLTAIEARPGETIRLRLINGSSEYAFRFQADGHPLTVISADGSPMAPVEVDNLIIHTGERFDVLLKADRPGSHWLRAVTLDGNEVLAVLRYEGAGRREPEPSPVRWGPRLLTPEAMRSTGPVTLAGKPREIPIVMGGSMSPYRWSIGDQFYPKAVPIEIRQGEPIRFLFRNPTGMDHPFHIHGHSFHVLGKPGALNLTDPVLKDTVNVPANSDLAVQWVADNPGRWFFHCHIAWHLATGMARVLEVRPA
jgi:FtsP/CotA-like multicopper oxidase with cupredoxin domain